MNFFLIDGYKGRISGRICNLHDSQITGTLHFLLFDLSFRVFRELIKIGDSISYNFLFLFV